MTRGLAISAVAFWLGASLAMSFLNSLWGGAVTGWIVVATVAALFTVAWLMTRQGGTAPTARWIRRIGWLVLIAGYGLWLYLAISFGLLLAWTVPSLGILAVFLAAIAAALTARRPSDRWQLPFALPLGMWIALVLSGWPREENLLRCDDFLAVQAPVELIVPSHPDLASCRRGEVRPAGRFPRTVWEAPDGRRLIFTTQGSPIPRGIDGAVCEARLGDGSRPTCVGLASNKSQGLIDLPESGRLLVMQWGVRNAAGAKGAVVLEVTRDEGLKLLAEHWFENESFGEGFYEPRNATLYMFADTLNGVHRVTLPDFVRLPTLPFQFTPGELRYNPVTGEGVACGSPGGAALRGEPFELRFFADGGGSLLERVSMTWGCDWDEADRKVYVTVPNLGLLDRIDYDSGRVEKRWFIGPGMRSVAYDRVRRRVYFTDFLRGYVVAFDERSERIVDRWFVGRFSRWVRLTRDGGALIATGNLGVVRIPLAN